MADIDPMLIKALVEGVKLAGVASGLTFGLLVIVVMAIEVLSGRA